MSSPNGRDLADNPDELLNKLEPALHTDLEPAPHTLDSILGQARSVSASATGTPRSAGRSTC